MADEAKQRIIRILKKIPAFFGLADAEYEALIGTCPITRFEAGMRVFEEGKPGNEMYVVLAGTVDIVHKDRLLHTAGPGEIIGEIAVVLPVRRSASAVAGSDISLMKLDRDLLDSLLGRAPRVSYIIMRNISRTLAERLITANDRIPADTLKPAARGIRKKSLLKFWT